MVTWIIERNVFSEVCFDKMVSHLKSLSIQHEIVRIIPFVHELERPLKIDILGPVVCYGSIGIQKLASRENWHPGVWNSPLFDEDKVAQELGTDYLNADSEICLLKDVSKKITSSTFMKPNTDTKEFAGAVFEAEEVEAWVERMLKSGYFEEDILNLEVVISVPKRLGCEWRVVVVDGMISSYSCYKQYGIVKPQFWMPEEALNFTKGIIEKFNPADVYVIDICQKQLDGSFKVIEYNTFNSSGLYECKVEKIVDDINNFLNI